ncbi:MAG: PKD domain-containing protein [Cytophagales bacterium]|nr:PKD domain-containing protein [Cytophagales bacterium]MDW8385352.1 PKD domain-containing protein [Flammeovirgaceae bacterium]
MKQSIFTILGSVLFCCFWKVNAQNSIVALAGGSGTEVFYDIKELSDGTYLVAGSTSDLTWLQGLSPSMTQLDTATPADNAYAISPASGNFFVSGSGAANNLTDQRTLRRGFDNTGSGAVTTNYGFLLQLNATMTSVIRGVYLPVGAATNIKFIRMTNMPGEPTGDIYISGDIKRNVVRRESSYFIGKLNGNFVNNVPTGFHWVRSVYGNRNDQSPQPIISSLNQFNTQHVYFNHPWDVNKQGKVILVAGQYRKHPDNNTSVSFAEDFGAVHVLEPNGYFGYMPGWPVQRYLYYNGNRGGNNRQRLEYEVYYGDGFHFPNSIADYGDTSQIRWSEYYFKWENVRPFNRRHVLRSFSDQDVNAVFDDGNGRIRKGKYPLDAYFDIGSDTAIQPEFDANDGKTYFTYVTQNQTHNDIGYLGVAFSTNNNGRVYSPSAVLFDKQTGDFYIAGSHSYNNGDVGTFVPYIMCMDSLGKLKWFSRLYSETDANQNPLLATTDFHVNGLAMDYTNGQVVVTAYSEGKDVLTNLWEGDQVKDLELGVCTDSMLVRMNGNNKAQGWQNKITGSQTGNDRRFSWIGKLDRNGKLKHSTYVAEIANTTSTSNVLGSGVLTGYPTLNQGNPDLATTRIANQSVQVGKDGSVMILGKTLGGIPLTTTNGYQRYPLTSGATTIEFVRIYAPDLSRPLYSSVIGAGTATAPVPSNISAMNALRTSKGVVIVGAVSAGSTLLTANVPSWGKAGAASGNDAFLAHLQPTCYAKASITYKKTACASLTHPGSGLYTLTSTSTTLSGNASYEWYIAPLAGSYNATPDGTNKEFVVTQMFGDYKVRHIVTDASNGCKDTVEITFKAPLRLKAQISTPEEQTVGVPFNLTSASLYNNPIATQPAANLTYKWVYPRPTGVDTFIVQGSGRAPAVNSVVVNVAGTYDVSLYITDITSGNLCIDSAKIKLKVLPAPVLSFDTLRLSGGCGGALFRLTNTSTNIPSSNKLVFQNIVGVTPVQSDTIYAPFTQTVEYNVSGSGTFRLTRLDASNNVLGSPFDRSYNVPTAGASGSFFTYSPNRLQFMNGETIDFTNAAYPTATIDSVIWTVTQGSTTLFKDKRIPSDMNYGTYSFTSANAGTFNIKLTAYRFGGSCQQDTSITVVFGCPDSLITLFNGPDTTVLLGAPVTGFAKPAFPSFIPMANRSVTWTRFDGSTQAASTINPSNLQDSLLVVKVDTISVQAVTFGCTVVKRMRVTTTCPDSIAAITSAKNITVLPGQPISVTGAVRIPSIATIKSADTTNLAGNSSSLNNGNFAVNASAPITPGTYFVKVRANAHSCVVRDSAKVTVQSCPSLATVSASKSFTVKGDTVSFTPTFLASGYESATTFTWTRFNGSTISKSLTDTLLETATVAVDTVSLKVQTHGCSDSLGVIVNALIPSFDTTRVNTGCGVAFNITNTSQNHHASFKYMFEVVGSPTQRDTFLTTAGSPSYEVAGTGTIRLTILNAANQPVGNTVNVNFSVSSQQVGAFFTKGDSRNAFIRGETITFTNQGYPMAGLEAVRWTVIRNGTDSSTTLVNNGDANFINFPITFSQNGSYAIRMTAIRNSGACLRDTLMTGITVDCPDTIARIIGTKSFTILPNEPVDIRFSIQFPFSNPLNSGQLINSQGVSVSFGNSNQFDTTTEVISTPGTYFVKVLATTFGCHVRDSATITVQPCPDTLATFSGPANVLPGENATYTPTFKLSPSYASATTYTWIGFNGSSTSLPLTSSFQDAINSERSDTVFLAIQTYGCLDTMFLRVTASCSGVIADVTGGAPTARRGQSITFTDNSTIPLGYSGTKIFSTTSPATITPSGVFSSNADGTYKVYLDVNVLGCSKRDSAQIVVSCPPVVASIAKSADSIVGIPVSFSNTAPNAAIATNNWSFGDASNSTATGSTTSFTYTSAGTYTVRLNTALDGCTGSDSVQVKIIAPTGVCLAFKPRLFAAGNLITTTAFASNDVIRWFFVPFDTTVTTLRPSRDSLLLPFTTQTISASRFGYYYVIVTVNALNGCVAKSDLMPITNPAAGLTNEELASSVSVYPTVGAEKVNITIANQYVGSGLIQLFDNTGRLLQNVTMQKNSAVFETVLSLEALPTGLYTVVVTLDGATITKKVQR